MKGTTVANLVQALLQHGSMKTRVRILDERGKPRSVVLTSGGMGRDVITLSPAKAVRK